MKFLEEERKRAIKYRNSLKELCLENKPKHKSTPEQRKTNRERQRRYRLSKKLQQQQQTFIKEETCSTETK